MTKKELSNIILDRKGVPAGEWRNRWFRQLMAASKAELMYEAKVGQ